MKPEMAMITAAVIIARRGKAKRRFMANSQSNSPTRAAGCSASKPTNALARTSRRAGAAGSGMPSTSDNSRAARRISGSAATAASMRAAAVSDRRPSSQAAKSRADTDPDRGPDMDPSARRSVARLRHSSLSLWVGRSVLIALSCCRLRQKPAWHPLLKAFLLGFFLEMGSQPQQRLMVRTANGLGVDLEKLGNFRHVFLLVI